MIKNDSDNGFRTAQWRVLLATMICYLFFYTGRQTFGFAIPGIEEEFGISKANLGWVSAALLWAYAIGQSINGNLGDRFGGRRLMSLGAILSCSLNWLVSFSSGIWTLGFFWSLNGYAQSMGWAPGSRVLSNWWPASDRGKVYGAYVFAAGMSSVLAFSTSILMLKSGLDWRWIFRLPVLLLLLGGVLYFVLVRDRPEELGFEEVEKDPDKDSSDATKVETKPSFYERYRSVLSNPRFLVACFAIGFQSTARYGLLIWVPVHFLGTDWKSSGSGTWLSITLPIGMALGAITSGWASDKIFKSNRSRVISISLFLAALFSATMYWIPKDHFLVAPVLLLTGFFAYGPQSAFWALCPDLLGKEKSGTGTGVMNTFAYLLAGFGEPFIGWIIERNDNTALVFAVVAICCILGSVISIFIRK